MMGQIDQVLNARRAADLKQGGTGTFYELMTIATLLTFLIKY
jgi:hypothetical protein